MEVFLLGTLALLRPLFFIEIEGRLLGLNLFELAAIGLSALMIGAWLIRATVQKDVTFAPIDLVIVSFCLWCVCIYVVYIDQARIGEVAKLIIPLVTFTVARNVISTRHDYERLIFLMIVGFSVPIIASAAMIIGGQSVSYVNYWTGIPRYEGVYSGAHDLSHNTALMIMLIVLYVEMKRRQGSWRQLSKGRLLFFLGLAVAASICLYGARVRTPILGLLVFGSVILFFYSKKLLVLGLVALVSVGAIFADQLATRFFYDVSKVAAGEWEVEKLGSNRPNIWANNVQAFVGLPLDRQLAGVGVGNRQGSLQAEDDEVNVRNSHNDYLEVLIQTGIIGFVLFVAVQVLFFTSIRRMPPSDRYVLLALFAAVTVMNLASNSYVTRFGLAQMFYLALAIVGLRAGSEPRLHQSSPVLTKFSGAAR